MNDDEQKRRMQAFKKKSSIRQRSFEKLGDLMEDKKVKTGSDENSDDSDFDGDDVEDLTRVSRLDSVQFNSVMDTLAHHPIPEKKQVSE